MLLKEKCFWTSGLTYRIASFIRWIFFPSKTIQKNLDLSCKMDLDLWECLWRVKLITKFHRTDSVICSHSREGKPCLIAKHSSLMILFVSAACFCVKIIIHIILLLCLCCNFAIIWVLPFLNNLKDLDPSYKTDLDLWDCFGRKKTPSYIRGNTV